MPATNLIDRFNNIKDDEDSRSASKVIYEPEILKESAVDKVKLLYEEKLGPYGQLSLDLT